MRPNLPRKERFRLLGQEFSSYYKFFWRTEKKLRDIVFYSAQAQYISFFEGVLGELCDRGANICYITSDHDDSILFAHHPNILPFYFDALFPFVLPFLDAKVIVMTMPDLNLFHVRRSIYEANHIYLFHSLMSTHMGFRPGALDHFDTILCAGPHHLEEIRLTEKLYGLKPKCLLGMGYFRLEKIYAEHKNYQKKSGLIENHPPLILVAPSGHTENITSTCASELVSALLQAGFYVVFRPHPMTIYRKPEQLHVLIQKFGDHAHFRMDVETVSEKYLHQADVLISDWSGVALEYAFGTERPVLFIDLPKRQQNPEYQRIDIPPAEVFLRDKIGKVVRVDEIPQVAGILGEFLQQKDRYREKIAHLRGQYVYNFGNSSEMGADYILNIYNGMNDCSG